MAAFISVLSASLDRYRSTYWYGQPVYSTYPRLKSYLNIRLGEDYAALLAQPKLQNSSVNSSQISWLTDKLTKPQPLSKLPESEQIALKENLETRVGTVIRYAQQLLESENPEDNKWGQLLKKAFIVPDYDHVFVEEGRMVLAGWGFEPSDPAREGLFSKTIQRPSTEQFPPTQPPALPSDANGLDSDPIATNEDDNELKDLSSKNQLDILGPTEEDRNQGLTQDAEQVDASTAVTNLPESQQFDQELPDEKENNIAKSSLLEEKEGPSDPHNIAEIREPWTNEPIQDPTNAEVRADSNNRPPIPPQPLTFWQKWGRLKWLLLFLLLVLILLILFFGFKKCNTSESPSSALPELPGVIIPIDTTRVIKDPDTVRTIVSNRLNIALTGKSDRIEAFAEAFKMAYPGDEYKIIYFDTLTYRLQVQVPDSLREFLINDIPAKLKAFQMLVWNESLFQRNKLPADPGFSEAEMSWYFKKVKADLAWESTYGSKEIVVAIIDDGFDLSHPEFQNKVFKPWNVCERTTDVMSNPNAFHGTHVAGTALGARDNGDGVSGIAPDCRFMPIQVGDRNGLISSTAVIDAVLYAIHQGAHVINLSLGMSVDERVKQFPVSTQLDMIDHLYKGEEAFWNKICQMADSRNVTIVLAGGNEGVLIGLDPMQRNPLAIKVSATDPNNVRAPFSNFGPYSTISAPGVHIYNSLPRNRYDYLDGTSMACPIVAGGIALIKSLKPDISNQQLITLLQTTGLPLKSAGKKIGPLLQLDQAIKSAGGVAIKPIDDCSDIQNRLDSLKAEIERLKELCPDATGNVDTMKMPGNNDLSFTIGQWRSTTYIHNNEGEQVTVYFDFYPDGTGKVTLVEPDNTQCTANVALTLKPPVLGINQQESAVCSPPPQEYNAYTFSCQPDENGYADCTAQNKKIKANRFKFRLVKIKH